MKYLKFSQLSNYRAWLIQLSDQISNVDGGRELSMVKTSLQKGRWWLGKAKGFRSKNTGYVNDGDRTSVEDIEERLDVLAEDGSSVFEDFPLDGNDIKVIDTARELLKDRIITPLENTVTYGAFSEEVDGPAMNNALSKLEEAALMKAWFHLCEARMAMGEMLGAIRDKS